MARDDAPVLTRVAVDGVTVWTDKGLRERSGVVAAFSERTGGVSSPPFASLNLAGHVGDDSEAVDVNRSRLLATLGLNGIRDRLTLAEQVHGARVALVGPLSIGSGAYSSQGRPPVTGADALITRTPLVPLLLCFADCVPVILVAPGPAVSVVHAGWRGALASLPGVSASLLAEQADCDEGDIVAYIGPHVRDCHYEVSAEILSQFVNTFGTFARARTGGLDLDAVVRQSLTDAGVSPWRITSLGACTAEETNRYFSYRAEQGMTGRHGALACIVP